MDTLFEKMGLFYLGKNSDDDTLELYKSKHLTTHAAIIGMTGSGKTGLGIGIIEEAAIDNIPSIIIDPKGDMGNLCLDFPNMNSSDFQPYIDPIAAQNKNLSIQELAKITANTWKKGIESFGQDLSRVKKLSDVKKTIYTPGSSAGVGVNILGNFNSPSDAILEDSDLFSSLINSTVTSLLSLVGIDSSPLSSKEHLLLSNIFNFYWSKGKSLSLEDLIGLIATPPFKKIGVLSLKSFYPQNERMKLAILLNNVISSVTFSSWIKGEDLDIQNMMYDENGNAKISIFSIAHLNDNERMFFVTILLNAYINWMRTQRGSSILKSILYMDEIFGFFPPTKNPPSKEPMLLLLKQARAFGTGVVLSTQNPVDIDYKGLSNIGTWFIGKLQTKQDIEKVLDGVAAKSDLSKNEISKKIATLKERNFFLKNVHVDHTDVFYTRWVLSYLKGPMTKNDIRKLMKNQKEHLTQKENLNAPEKTEKGDTKPILSEGIKEYFADTNINSNDPFYPYMYGHVKLRFYNLKRDIDSSEDIYLKLELRDDTNSIGWENSVEEEKPQFTSNMNNSAKYTPLPAIILDEKNLNPWKKVLSDFIYNTKRLELFSCKSLKIESKNGQSKQDFTLEIKDTLKMKKDDKIEKLQSTFQNKYDRLQDKLQRLEFKLEKEKSDVTSKATDTFIGIGMTVLGAIFGRKAMSASTISRGASAIKKGKSILGERNDVKNTMLLIDNVKEDISNLQNDLKDEIDKIDEQFSIDNYAISDIAIKPRRSDVLVEDIAILWER